ncbi:unnamed protein product [Bathycoccus prasinos]
MSSQTRLYECCCSRCTSRGTTFSRRRGKKVAFVSRSSSSSSSSSSSGTLDELISIASSDDRGIGSTRRPEIESIIDRLLLEEEEKNTKNNNFSVSARWKLLWTSERETLFLLETFQNSLAYQTIDEKAKTLRNAVEFSGGNAFVVESEIEILDERKVNFTFLSAGLKFSNGFTLPVPPVGKGWFENIYVGERYRVARDSRGDTLIVERC